MRSFKKSILAVLIAIFLFLLISFNKQNYDVFNIKQHVVIINNFGILNKTYILAIPSQLDIIIYSKEKIIKTKKGSYMRVGIYFEEKYKNIKKPTLYFAPGGSSSYKEYKRLFYHLIKKGYIVIAASYLNFDYKASMYITDNFFEAFTEGRKICKLDEIDDTRVGLIGHSAGAGVLPSLGYKFFVEEKMGSNGRFIFGATPWVDFQYENNMTLPKDTNFVTQWYENDHTTDPRIYLDIYKNVKVTNKAFIIVKDATHYTIETGFPIDIVENGIYKPLEALAEYTFQGANREVIFPNKNKHDKYKSILKKGSLPSQKVFAKMVKEFKNNGSAYPCDTTINGYAKNPRKTECERYINLY